MDTPQQEIVLGNVHIRYVDGRTFIFKDLHNPQRQLGIVEEDVPDLVMFLVHASKAARQSLSVTRL